MTGRASSRRRSKTQRLIDFEDDTPISVTSANSRGKRPVQNSLGNSTGADPRSETPSSSRSRLSTPTSSRAASRTPSPTPPPKAGRRRASTTAPSSRASSRKKTPVSNNSSKIHNGRGGGRSGTATPLSRASRSSSVSSRKAPGKKPGRKGSSSTQKVPKLKLKVSNRGYNPDLVPESEYHYGSDFDDSEPEPVYDDEEEDPKESESSEEESSDEDSDELVDSDADVDWEEDALAQSRSTTPVPFWLKTEDEEQVPELTLPRSSDDLLIDSNQAFRAAGVYEVLRHYYLLLRLSLFRFEDFCAALASEEQSNLLSEVHIALLKAIVRAEEKDNTTWGPMDHKDSINAMLFFVDSMTWPEALRQYLSSDPTANAEPLAILKEYQEYPVEKDAKESKAFIDARISLLGFLADQFITTNAVREDIHNEGALPMEDHCRVCYRLGDMVVCEMCNGTYHLACLSPPLDDVPEYDWQCYICQEHQIEGVIDCVDDQEKTGTKIRHDTLGFDRAGNKYWFLCRRIFVEEVDWENGNGNIRYYTSVPQFEELMEALDAKYFEADVTAAIEVERTEIERQMELTEKLTKELKPKPSQKSYLELENHTIVKGQEEREQEALEEDRKRQEAAEE